VIDAQEERDVTAVVNIFSQTVVTDDTAEHQFIVRICIPSVDMLVSIAPDVYGPYVTANKSGQHVLIVECLNTVYGTMVEALLYYKKFVKSLVKKGFKLNPYNGCVANKTVDGKQITICFQVDYCKILHVSTKVVDEAIEWIRTKYESIFKNGSGAMKFHRGKYHKYLGMALVYSHKGECRITIYDYLDDILDAFDKAVENHGDGWILVAKRLLKKTAAPARQIRIT
jgi:hypothetical protein